NRSNGHVGLPCSGQKDIVSLGSFCGMVVTTVRFRSEEARRNFPFPQGGFEKKRNCSSRPEEAHWEENQWNRASLRRLLRILESALPFSTFAQGRLKQASIAASGAPVCRTGRRNLFRRPNLEDLLAE